MKLVRVILSVLFLLLLLIGLSSGAMRYHLVASTEPKTFAPPGTQLVGQYVRVTATALLDSAVVLQGGPIRMRLIPLREFQNLWLLRSPIVPASGGTEHASFSGRLVSATQVPFLRHKVGAIPGLDRGSLMLEEGHRPKRSLAWGFVVVVALSLTASQGLVSLWEKIRRRQ